VGRGVNFFDNARVRLGESERIMGEVLKKLPGRA